MAHLSPIIGYHRAPLSQKFGAPRQPNLVASSSVIEMLAPYDTPLAFAGLEAFSHIWVSWQCHHNVIKSNTKPSVDHKTKPANKQAFDSSANKQAFDSPANTIPFRAQVRPPRLGGNKKIGVFASRSLYRPSGLGLSVVALNGIAIVEGRVMLVISGADMIDGTPIIDIKPYVAYSDALINTKSGFALSAPIPFEVDVTELASDQFLYIINAQRTDENEKSSLTRASMLDGVRKQLVGADIAYIKALIAQDPRPAYRCGERDSSFTMRYKSVDVSFCQIQSGQLQIFNVRLVE